jgi:hypothetical protein
MSNDVSNLLHVVLLLVVGLANYLLVMSRKSLTERIDALERLLKEVTDDLEKATTTEETTKI